MGRRMKRDIDYQVVAVQGGQMNYRKTAWASFALVFANFVVASKHSKCTVYKPLVNWGADVTCGIAHIGFHQHVRFVHVASSLWQTPTAARRESFLTPYSFTGRFVQVGNIWVQATAFFSTDQTCTKGQGQPAALLISWPACRVYSSAYAHVVLWPYVQLCLPIKLSVHQSASHFANLAIRQLINNTLGRFGQSTCRQTEERRKFGTVDH
jgi:hypothetical protein